jgi:hypothetical protein
LPLLQELAPGCRSILLRQLRIAIPLAAGRLVRLTLAWESLDLCESLLRALTEAAAANPGLRTLEISALCSPTRLASLAAALPPACTVLAPMSCTPSSVAELERGDLQVRTRSLLVQPTAGEQVDAEGLGRALAAHRSTLKELVLVDPLCAPRGSCWPRGALPAVLQGCRWLSSLHLSGGLGPAPEYTVALAAFLREGTALERLRVHAIGESAQAVHQIPLLRRGLLDLAAALASSGSLREFLFECQHSLSLAGVTPAFSQKPPLSQKPDSAREPVDGLPLRPRA